MSFQGASDHDVNLSQKKKVPTFYAGCPRDVQIFHADLIASIIAIIFGGIHCVPWKFRFPSHIEQVLWHIFAIVITVSPGLWGFLFLILTLIGEIPESVVLYSMVLISGLLTLLSIPIYIVARAALLVLAFTTLRSLPQAAYQTVDWINFIPHV